MYRADDLMVTQTECETGDYHRLAEAIRRGCEIRPKKVRGHFRRGDKMACALGAAAVGSGRGNKPNWKLLFRIFPSYGCRLGIRLLAYGRASARSLLTLMTRHPIHAKRLPTGSVFTAAASTRCPTP